MNYIKRQMEKTIHELSEQFPVVMVCGQRQTGKSTMLRHIASDDRKYITFDDMAARNLAKKDPKLFFETYGTKLIIDEFQRVPEILLEIKRIIDEKTYSGEDANGLFWLSGSQKFAMMKNLSETLVGRVAVLTLLPLSANEINGVEDDCFSPHLDSLRKKIRSNVTQKEVYEMIFRGGLPKIVATSNINRNIYYSSYMNAYIERDISMLEQVGKLEEFRNFVIYLAANTAQELKYDSAAKAVGVSAPTIKEWVSILERSGIIYILRPFNNGAAKRISRIPKCYFLDTGLASYLTSWPTAETLMNGASSGAFFETFVVSEILKGYYNKGEEPNLYYYRDKDQKEIDLLIVEGDEIYPIEIKKNKYPSEPDKNFSVLKHFNLKVMPGIVICLADELTPYNRNCWLCPVTLI